MKYKTSKDYEKLYKLVCEGFQAICYTDHYWTDMSATRQLCLAHKHDYEITLENVHNLYARVDMHKQKDKFISECERLNLEWIEP